MQAIYGKIFAITCVCAGFVSRIVDAAIGRTRIQRTKLTSDDLHQIATHRTPVADWPAVDEGLFAPGTFDDPSESDVPHSSESDRA